MGELIDRSKLMFLLERELDMNGITDWGKGYMEAIHDAMEHVKFMTTTTKAEIRNKAINEFFDELQKYEEDDWLKLKMLSIYHIAEQLKERE